MHLSVRAGSIAPRSPAHVERGGAHSRSPYSSYRGAGPSKPALYPSIRGLAGIMFPEHPHKFSSVSLTSEKSTGKVVSIASLATAHLGHHHSKCATFSGSSSSHSGQCPCLNKALLRHPLGCHITTKPQPQIRALNYRRGRRNLG